MAKKNTKQIVDDMEDDVLPIDIDNDDIDIDVSFSEVNDNPPDEEAEEEEEDNSQSEVDKERDELPLARQDNDEIEALRAENIKLKKSQTEAHIAAVEQYESQVAGNIENLINKIADAEEEGDTREKLKLQMNLTDLQEERTKAKNVKAQLQSDLAKVDATTITPKAAAPANVDTDSGYTPVEQNWMAKNKWYNKSYRDKTPLEREKKALVDDIFNELMQENRYARGSQDFITELDKRLSSMVNQNNRGNRPHGHVKGVNNTSVNSSADGNTLKLDKYDAYLLDSAGLDVKSDKKLAKAMKAMMMQESNPEYQKTRRIVIPSV